MTEEWLVGSIAPIFKNKGDANDVNNYGGITLLSCMSKLFTSILNDRLVTYNDEINLIYESQAGFRKGYSTIDHIFVLTCLIDLFVWKKNKLFCLFVDYSKVFDMVWRDGLWYKLVKHGITSKLYNLVKNMYNIIKSCVVVNQEISEFFVSHKGMRQWENIFPLLFAFNVNDLEEHLLNGNCTHLKFNDQWLVLHLRLLVLTYADDTVIMGESEEGINHVLRVLENYVNSGK